MASLQEQDALKEMITTFRVSELQLLLGDFELVKLVSESLFFDAVIFQVLPEETSTERNTNCRRELWTW